MGLYSDRAGRIGSENAFKIGPHIRSLEETGRDVIRCNLGEPDFPVPGFIKEEVKRQIDLDNTHYCDPQGIPSLRAAIAKQFSETRGIRAEAERVVVFPGGKPPIGLCQQTYCGPGDEVVYPSPGFPIYESFIPYVGATPVPLHLKEENEFSLSGEELASVLTEKTKLIFLNFPSNPTGGVASPEQLREIASVIRSRCCEDVRIYSDEIYEHILFDSHRHHSILSCPGMERNTILVSGASKSFAWTGGRIGWALFPTREEAEVFKNLNINYFSCTAAYNQEGVRLGLESPEGPVGDPKDGGDLPDAPRPGRGGAERHSGDPLPEAEGDLLRLSQCGRGLPEPGDPGGLRKPSEGDPAEDESLDPATDVPPVRSRGGDDGPEIFRPDRVRPVPLSAAFNRHGNRGPEEGTCADRSGRLGSGGVQEVLRRRRALFLGAYCKRFLCRLFKNARCKASEILSREAYL